MLGTDTPIQPVTTNANLLSTCGGAIVPIPVLAMALQVVAPLDKSLSYSRRRISLTRISFWPNCFRIPKRRQPLTDCPPKLLTEFTPDAKSVAKRKEKAMEETNMFI